MSDSGSNELSPMTPEKLRHLSHYRLDRVDRRIYCTPPWLTLFRESVGVTGASAALFKADDYEWLKSHAPIWHAGGGGGYGGIPVVVDWVYASETDAQADARRARHEAEIDAEIALMRREDGESAKAPESK